MIQIAIIGSGMEISTDVYQIAKEIGEELAKNDVILICGGKKGVMEAACEGAHKLGMTVGILPSIKRSEANEYVKIKIPTNLGEDRNYIIIQSVEAVICISGAVGTRMEAEYALKQGVPVITIPKSGGTSKKLSEEFPDQVIIAKNAKDAVKKALEAV